MKVTKEYTSGSTTVKLIYEEEQNIASQARNARAITENARDEVVDVLNSLTSQGLESIILISPSGIKFNLSVDDNGQLSANQLPAG